MPSKLRLSLGALALLASSQPAFAQNAAPDQESLYLMVQELQRQVQALKAQLAASGQSPAASNTEVQQQIRQQDAKIELLAQEAERNRTQQKQSKTHLGGYGELHYNNLNGEGGQTDLEEIDFHRFVVYFGHDFSDRVRFRSELEVEHALTRDAGDTDTSCVVNDANGDGVLQPGEVTCGRPAPRSAGTGEVELEQAYIEFDINDQLTARGGLFLIPVGILNETHEPPTFYGVERNPVENAIIPSTWWAGGGGLTWRPARGWAIDAALHEGLRTSAANRFAVRSGRQKTSSALASDLALTTRVKWTGIPGIELAATYQYQSDITQGLDPAAGDANLFEAHAVVQRGSFGLRALYAYWDLEGAAPEAFGADEQFGFYLEPSFRINQYVGVFTRYNLWNNQAGSGVRASDPGNTEKVQYDLGVNIWPVENVVLKADYQIQDNKDGRDRNGFNLGVGYQF